MPSGIARIVIMAAVALGLVEAFRVQSGSNIARGMFLIITYTAAAVRQDDHRRGELDHRARPDRERAGVEGQWSQWFVAFLPCDVVTIIVAWALILWLFPPEKAALEGGYGYLREELKELGPFSAMETKAALLIGAATLLWMTDFMHHISSAKIGLGIGLIALLPYVGLLRTDDLKKRQLPAGVFRRLGAQHGPACCEATKSIELLTNIAFAWMQPLMTNVVVSTAVLYWTAFVYHLFLSSDIPMLGTSLPLVMNFAKTHSLNPARARHDLDLRPGGKIFAYQSARAGGGLFVRLSSTPATCCASAWLITIVEFIALMIIVPLYWPLIGIQ